LIGLPFGLKCEQCPREHKCDQWEEGATSYKYEGKPLFKVNWERCPVDYLKSDHLKIALDTLGHAKISPIADWPFGFSAWFVEYTAEIHRVIEERKAEEWANG
jgi:hypothetical protein